MWSCKINYITPQKRLWWHKAQPSHILLSLLFRSNISDWNKRPTSTEEQSQ